MYRHRFLWQNVISFQLYSELHNKRIPSVQSLLTDSLQILRLRCQVHRPLSDQQEKDRTAYPSRIFLQKHLQLFFQVRWYRASDYFQAH